MSERKLGDSGLVTPPLILGGNVFGWTADPARIVADRGRQYSEMRHVRRAPS